MDGAGIRLGNTTEPGPMPTRFRLPVHFGALPPQRVNAIEKLTFVLPGLIDGRILWMIVD